MYHNREDFRESAHIAEELFLDSEYELERQCMAVKSVIKKGICSMDEALSAYKITSDQYFTYLGKSESSEIRMSVGTLDIPITTSLVQVYVGMIDATWSLPPRKRKKISEVLNTILNEEEVRTKLDKVK